MQETKRCRDCGQVKPVSEFGKLNHTRQDGTKTPQPCCKPCRAQQNRTRYHSDPAHRARHLMFAMNAQKRCKATGQRVDVGAGAQMILEAKECAYCGQPNDGRIPFALDHHQPLALGGAHTLENLVACCEPCNRAKHDMPPADYAAWIAGIQQRASQHAAPLHIGSDAAD